MTTQTAKPSTKVVRNKPPAAGKGRPRGAPNKVTKELKDMILHALDGAGGITYLEARAKDPKTAAAFLTLVGKVLPLQVTGPNGGAMVHRIEQVIVDPQG